MANPNEWPVKKCSRTHCVKGGHTWTDLEVNQHYWCEGGNGAGSDESVMEFDSLDIHILREAMDRTSALTPASDGLRNRVDRIKSMLAAQAARLEEGR